jgi:cyclin-dependent kinase-like
MLGNLTRSQKECFSKIPRFIGLKFPEINKIETLDKHYAGKVSPQGIGLMNGLLKMDPADRFDCYKCLNHPYFDEVKK